MPDQMLTDEELARLKHATTRLANALRMLGTRANESAEYNRRWTEVAQLYRGEILQGL